MPVSKGDNPYTILKEEREQDGIFENTEEQQGKGIETLRRVTAQGLLIMEGSRTNKERQKVQE